MQANGELAKVLNTEFYTMDFKKRFECFKKLERIVDEYAEMNNLSSITELSFMVALLVDENNPDDINIEFNLDGYGRIKQKHERAILSDKEKVVFDEIVKRYNNA